jgi:hypothetical protein
MADFFQCVKQLAQNFHNTIEAFLLEDVVKIVPQIGAALADYVALVKQNTDLYSAQKVVYRTGAKLIQPFAVF